MSLWLVRNLYADAVEREARDNIAYDHLPHDAVQSR
jgi:hypothetical protein